MVKGENKPGNVPTTANCNINIIAHHFFAQGISLIGICTTVLFSSVNTRQMMMMMMMETMTWRKRKWKKYDERSHQIK